MTRTLNAVAKPSSPFLLTPFFVFSTDPQRCGDYLSRTLPNHIPASGPENENENENENEKENENERERERERADMRQGERLRGKGGERAGEQEGGIGRSLCLCLCVCVCAWSENIHCTLHHWIKKI